ncbi:MAG: penicillin-binding transpeptidase domain-containing protein, partial [Acidimicrobiia bacterium]
YSGVDLRTAMHKSINTVFARLIADVGVKPTAEMALRLGIKGIDLNAKQYGVLALGTQETSALEQASAFGVFANHGVRVEPTPVLRILDVKGETIEDNRKPNGNQVISEAVADNVTSVLQGVVEKGTGTRAKIGRPAAGKTGTSENWENAWFVGYTPTLSTAVWMGHPRANLTMAIVHGVPLVVGGSLPAMFWLDFMIEAVKDVEPLPFTQAAPILPSRAEAEAKARVVAEQRLTERSGFDLPPARTAEDLPSGGPLWAPAPKPNAKAPAAPPRRTTTSTAPPSSYESQPNEDAPPPPPESSTSTTQPPPWRRPPPPRDPLPLPFPGD